MEDITEKECCYNCKHSWLSPLDNRECVCCNKDNKNYGFEKILDRFEKRKCCEKTR